MRKDAVTELLLDLFVSLRTGLLTSGLPDVRKEYLNRLADVLRVEITDNAEQARAKVFPRLVRGKEHEDGKNSTSTITNPEV